MKYQIGDKFVVDYIECEVIFTNCGKAWVAPLEDIRIYEDHYLKNVSFEVLDEKGRDSKGRKALVLHNKDCQAV